MERPLDIEVSCEISTVCSDEFQTNSDGGSPRTRMRQGSLVQAQAAAMKTSSFAHYRAVTWRLYLLGMLGCPRAISGYYMVFRPPNLPTFVWRATGTSQLKCFP